jgi:hypothetical protein
MDADIDSHVATCITCQAATNKNKPNPPPLVPLPEPGGPNRRVHCDLLGPVRLSTKKNLYVMVITDAFTKFATAVALPGKEAMHVAQALLAHFYTFGIPQQLVTDQGREYCNELEKLMWTALKIRHNVTTPYGDLQQDPQALHCDGLGGRGGVNIGLGGVLGAIALCLQHGGVCV